MGRAHAREVEGGRGVGEFLEWVGQFRSGNADAAAWAGRRMAWSEAVDELFSALAKVKASAEAA
ncbi:hypothetical protein CEG18_05720 [Pseudomonas nitroreducens]|uniref:Uncharacterized protein n=1 Tax=Pseudomonas nitroreducens TaxID=46680 RepID=A0A246FBS4_PSENT|nr:hypothetical protein CEG18_05720 [Pseudomonas nitroreducens]